MRIPNFNSEEGSILYSDTVGKMIAPRVGEQLLDHLRPILTARPAAHVLELGCGPGTVTIPMARLCPSASVLAVDSSAAMVRLCQEAVMRAKLTNVEVRVMNANQVDFAPDAFDLVVCNLAFPFFSRPDESIAAVYDILRRGGEAWFSVPGRETWAEFFAVAEQVLGDAVHMARPFLAKFSQAERLPEALSQAGFTVSETRLKLPFHFRDGQSVLAFFARLFQLLDHAPPAVREGLAGAIDEARPDGFTMHYEAVILRGIRTEARTESRTEP
ncbi:MAG: class I SAM-dependent methyltransferase [Alicyclobacillus sp.]|nr:class I SAM-dependent methyltransferase [Alicyclobacillus sp.]